MMSNLIITFDYVQKMVFVFSGMFVRMITVPYYSTVSVSVPVQYDIVLHVKLNNSALTETLKTVKNSNM